MAAEGPDVLRGGSQVGTLACRESLAPHPVVPSRPASWPSGGVLTRNRPSSTIEVTSLVLLAIVRSPRSHAQTPEMLKPNGIALRTFPEITTWDCTGHQGLLGMSLSTLPPRIVLSPRQPVPRELKYTCLQVSSNVITRSLGTALAAIVNAVISQAQLRQEGETI